MAIADRTFSFRAPAELADRLERAQRTFQDLVASGDASEDLSHELDLELYRRMRRAGEELSPNAFVRAVTEAFVAAVERTQRDRERVEEFRAFATEDADGESWRAAAAAGWLERD